MEPKHILHIVGGIIVVVSVYDMVAPGISPNLYILPTFPTSNNMTNLVIGGALFAVPFFL